MREVTASNLQANFSNFYSGANWFGGKISGWYENIKQSTQSFFESDALVVNPSEHFPKDIQSQLYSEINFKTAIQTIQANLEEKSWQPQICTSLPINMSRKFR